MHYAGREARLVALPVPCKHHVQVQTWVESLEIVLSIGWCSPCSVYCNVRARPRSLESATYSDILKQTLSDLSSSTLSPTHFGPPSESSHEMVSPAHIFVV